MPAERIQECNLLLYKDPPEHTKYRTILQRRFTPKVVGALADPMSLSRRTKNEALWVPK